MACITLPSVAINAVFALGLILNSYKIFLVPFEPYNIFPWSPEENTAKSSSFWLICHTLTALLLLYNAWRWSSGPQKKWPDGRRSGSLMESEGNRLRVIGCHVLFALGVIPNIFHLGNKHWLVVFLVNFGALAGLLWTLAQSEAQAYFMILNVPVLFEALKLFSF